jgi:hypothetical protein
MQPQLEFHQYSGYMVINLLKHSRMMCGYLTAHEIISLMMYMYMYIHVLVNLQTQ